MAHYLEMQQALFTLHVHKSLLPGATSD